MKKKKPNNFCVTRPRTCTMNYCDENGCQDRERNLVYGTAPISHKDDTKPNCKVEITNERNS